MKNSILIRIISIPIGVIHKTWEMAKEGSRDIQNKIRFKGAIIDSGCCINNQSEIARNTHILNDCLINNSKIAQYSYIGKNCSIQNTEIGSFCSIANDVLFGLGKHPIELISTSTLFYRQHNTLGIELIDKDIPFEEYANISVGNDVWIGARAIIMDGIKIGNGAIVAANSVVTKDVPPYAIVAGVPAKIIKYRFEIEKIERLLNLQWWAWPLPKIKQSLSELHKF